MVLPRKDYEYITQSKDIFLSYVFHEFLPQTFELHSGGAHGEFVRFEFSSPFYNRFDEEFQKDREIVKQIIRHLGGKIVSDEDKMPIIALF